MGTLRNPGPVNCLAKLEADEPYFLLMGRDPVGAGLVEMWAYARSNYLLKETGSFKLTESLSVAAKMRAYCETELGRSSANVLDLLPVEMLADALRRRGVKLQTAAEAYEADSAPRSLEQDIAAVLNRHSQDSVTNTPDYVLAQFLQNALFNLNTVLHSRVSLGLSINVSPRPKGDDRVKGATSAYAREASTDGAYHGVASTDFASTMGLAAGSLLAGDVGVGGVVNDDALVSGQGGDYAGAGATGSYEDARTASAPIDRYEPASTASTCSDSSYSNDSGSSDSSGGSTD